MKSIRVIVVFAIAIMFFNVAKVQSNWVENPYFFNRSDVTKYGSSLQSLGDIDKDGYADMVSCSSEGICFFRNRGDAENIEFDRIAEWEQSLQQVELYLSKPPILTDLNNDGFSDLIFYKDYNTITCWMNTGDNANIDFVQADSLINSIKMAGYELKSIADLDQDGDQDILVTQTGIYFILRNTGTGLDPVWERDANPITIIGNECCMILSVMFVDWDNDNDYELAVSLGWPEASGYMTIAENTGSLDSMVYNFSEKRMYLGSYWGFNYSFGDVTGNGKVELMSPARYTGLSCWNINALTDEPFTKLKTWYHMSGAKETGITLCSTDKPDSLDLYLLYTSGMTDYWDGYLDLKHYSISGNEILLNNVQNVVGDGRLFYPSIQKVDLGQDGSFLLISAKIMQGEYWDAAPIGNVMLVQILESNPYQYNLGDYFQQFFTDTVYYDPKMVDIDHDGTLDLFMQDSGSYMFWENTGTLYEPLWEKRPEWITGLPNQSIYQCAIVDMNNDGLEDIVFSEHNAAMQLFLNTGTDSLPHWTYDPGVFDELPVYEYTTPCFYDIDGDADPDLLFSTEIGAIYCYVNEGVKVNVEGKAVLPHQFRVEQNYPNPFNPETMIRYELPEQSFVQVSIYDITGRKVTTLVKEQQPAGAHSVRFDGSDLASGVYVYTIRAGEFSESRKMVLVR